MKKYIFVVIISFLAANCFSQTTTQNTSRQTNSSRQTQSSASADGNGTQGIMITPIADQIYTGGAIVPKAVVKDGSRVLVENVDYILAYANNINVGVASVTISGKGNYRDTKVANFNITPKPLNSLLLNPVTDQTYQGGTPIVPEVVVKDGAKNLAKDVDYTIVCTNNVNVGTASATITGKGNYKDSKTFQFKINPKSMGNAVVPPTRSSTGSNDVSTAPVARQQRSPSAAASVSEESAATTATAPRPRVRDDEALPPPRQQQRRPSPAPAVN